MKLTEGEKLAVIGALAVTAIRAPKSKTKGSNIRLMKKLFRDVCLRRESYDKIEQPSF